MHVPDPFLFCWSLIFTLYPIPYTRALRPVLAPVHGAGEGGKGEREIPSLALYQRGDQTPRPVPSLFRRVESQGPCAGRNRQRQRCRSSAEVKENDEVFIVSPVPHEQNLFLLVPQDPHALLVQKTCGAELLSKPNQLAVKPVYFARTFGTSGLGTSKTKRRNKGRKNERRNGKFELFRRFAGSLPRRGR